MNIKLIDKNNFIIKINSWYKKYDDKDIKEILYIIKDTYDIDIYGSYKVDIYEAINFITLIRIKRIEQDDYIRTIDLDIKKHSKELELQIDDFTLINNYKKRKNNSFSIKGSTIKKEDIIKLCEHYSLNLQ